MRSLCALTAAALLVLPASAASAAPTAGMIVPIKVVEAGGQAIDVQLLYSCEPKNETAVLSVAFGKTSKGPSARAKAPFGKMREKVECGVLRRHTVRVPVLRDGPVPAGEKITLTSELHAANGVRLHSATSSKKVQANIKKKGGGGLGKGNPLGNPFGGLFGGLLPS
ncbi:hypothetical protein [Actinocorallia sp. A-T 12471]|uniref:hypothetical protein n=1 Tax=Actinocorallia sp. A-T 12471 TaxID=3089813 RepID=UPI0029CDAECB|nr:hypothetical protein [Actinocorallia sp. A-T 12471]MDX6739599.1 hypothetical protein [Actinocorallia sp. A-T 12471]